MSMDATELLNEALGLPAEARAALAARLIESLDETIDPDAEKLWAEEITRRLKELDKVAYVRFASVYLEFADVSEFMNELKTLVRSRAGGR